MTTDSKLPQADTALIQDPDLAAALERELSGLSGKPLERAHAAIRRVFSSDITAPFAGLVDAYRKAIHEAIK